MKKTSKTQTKKTQKYQEPKEFKLGKKYVSELKKLGVEVRYNELSPGAFLYYGADEVGWAFDWSLSETKIGWCVKSNSSIRLNIKKSFEVTDDGKLKTSFEPEFINLGPFTNTEKFDEARIKMSNYILALKTLKEQLAKELKTKKKNGK